MGVYFWTTFQNHSSGHLEAHNMAPLQFIMSLCLVGAVLGAQKLEGNTETEREERSLLNTFPFNAQVEDASSETVEPQGRLVPAENLSPRDDSQRNDDIDVSFIAVATERPGRDGRRCIDKVEMVEETVYDEVVQCDHSYDRRCHTTYVTHYVSTQEEECEENFRKNCFIDYETECWTKHEEHLVTDDVVSCKTVHDEKCFDQTSGYTTFENCTTWPREVCSVSQQTVPKYTPITGCDKIPTKVCAPEGCTFVQGDEHCYDKTQTIVQDAPKEECSLEPN